MHSSLTGTGACRGNESQILEAQSGSKPPHSLALGSGALVVVAAGSGGTGGTGCSVSAGGAHAEGVDRLGLGSEGTWRELSRYCDVVHFMSKAGYFNVKETKYAFLGVWGGAVA